MTTQREQDPLSLFWASVCAIGTHGPSGPNAFISVSVFGASIVPEKPRILTGIYKTNYSAELVADSGTLAITVLAEHQVDLLTNLGLDTGRGRSKLDGLDFALTESGDPYFPEGSALIECNVIDTMDAGDALFFLCRVDERYWLSDVAPLERVDAMTRVGENFHARWREKQEREQAASRSAMHW